MSQISRIKVMLESIKQHTIELEYAVNKYEANPARFKPQLDNAVQNISSIGVGYRIILQTLGELKNG